MFRSRNFAITATALVWIPSVLILDVSASLTQQYLLGLGTWALLLALLRGESSLVRAQTAIVVVFATFVEYTFSPWLEVYVYRLDNVPLFVPPGHGMVYLAAFSLGRSDWFAQHATALITATIALGGMYAVWGLSPLAPRLDLLGAVWYLCLLGFLRWGRSRMLYVGAFAVVTYLEILGTWLGNWTWAGADPTGVIPIGNPPTGAAGGYGWFDLVAMSAAPAVLALWARWRGARVQPAGTVAASRSNT
jgi:hypothetical protein